MECTLNHHWCVGIDLHKDTLTACVFCGCCGEVSFQKIACKCRRQIAEYFAALPRPHTVAIERVGFYRWLWELLEPLVEKLVLADATQARALAGRRLKTDREDAFNIAELLWRPDGCPLSYAPPLEVQFLRDLTRHRHGFSRQHARVLCSREVDHERQQPAWPGTDAERRTDPLPQGPGRKASGAARRRCSGMRR